MNLLAPTQALIVCVLAFTYYVDAFQGTIGRVQIKNTCPPIFKQRCTAIDRKLKSRTSYLMLTETKSTNNYEPGDPNLGYPDDPAWGWNKAAPKTSLSDPNVLGPHLPTDQSWSAQPWELNLVELVHWLPIIPAVLMANQVFTNSAYWSAYLDGDTNRQLLMLLSPIIAFFGGLPGIMMHTYEGWQVAPFVNPLSNPDFKIKEYNNEWLRIVAYQFIFVMQYVGLQTFSLGIYGSNSVVGIYLPALSIFGFLVGYLGNQHPKPKLELFGHPTLPLSWYTIVPFAFSTVLNLFAFLELGHHVFPSDSGIALVVKSIAAPVLIGAGGAIEGLLAETRFNQWIHFFAVVLFNAGFWVQWYMYNNV